MGLVGSFGRLARSSGDDLLEGASRRGVRAIRSIEPLIEELVQSGKYSAEEIAKTRLQLSQGNMTYVPQPKRMGDVNASQLVGEHRGQAPQNFNHSVVEAQQNAQFSPTTRDTPIHQELQGMDSRYIATNPDEKLQQIIKTQSDLQRAAEDEALKDIDKAYNRRKKRAEDAGTPDKKIYTDNENRLFRGVKGTGIEALNTVIRNFTEVMDDLHARAITSTGPGAYRQGGGIKRWRAGEHFPGEMIPKEVTKQNKATHGPLSAIEGHHMWSNEDSSMFAEVLNRFGDVFKFNAYAWIAKNYKMLPGDWDLNLANIPVGPHRIKGQGNLHAWLKKMGFEDFWEEFITENPGQLSKNQVFEAIETYFDTVFYPSILKMDQLVRNAPNKFEWKGAYIPEYLIRDARNRLAAISETYNPFEISAKPRDLIQDDMHDMAAQAGWDRQTQNWENIDGIPVFSKPKLTKDVYAKK